MHLNVFIFLLGLLLSSQKLLEALWYENICI